MAGNTRGKLKERFEGVHRNFDWSRQHLIAALALIKEHNPNLTQGIQSLADAVDTLDELAMNIYAKL